MEDDFDSSLTPKSDLLLLLLLLLLLSLSLFE